MDFEKERSDYKKKVSVVRLGHMKHYWDEQTQIENAYLENYKQDRLAKQRRDLDHWRTSICNIAMHTKKKIVTIIDPISF